jgi:Undecaprenyl-phosphate glucose phosphotransferase
MQPTSPTFSAQTTNETNIPNAQANRLHACVTGLYFDKRGSISRPMFLLTIAILDIASVVLAGIIAAKVSGAHVPLSAGFIGMALALGLTVSAVLHHQWSYTIPSLRRLSSQWLKIATSMFAVFVTVGGIAHLLGIAAYDRSVLSCWLFLGIAMLCALRWCIRQTIVALSQSGCLVRRTVIVGGGRETADLMAALGPEDQSQLKIFGIFDDRFADRDTLENHTIAKLGTFAQLSNFCRDEGIDLLIVTVPLRAEDRLMTILQQLFTLPVDIRISALNSKLRLNASAYTTIGQVPLLAVMDKPLSDWDRAAKNIEDRLLGALLLVAAAPIMALVALAIRWETKGPIFFRQNRYGFDNELVKIFKFRSMYTDTLDPTASKLVTRDDARVTRVGRFIRRTSLDELPQLFNVLRGEMALVGPRPHATQAKAERDLYEDVVQGYFARHRVKPGVTGWAQINGWRGETDTHEKLQQRIAHDLHYIDNWSIGLDLYILAMTPLSLISAKNAY